MGSKPDIALSILKHSIDPVLGETIFLRKGRKGLPVMKAHSIVGGKPEVAFSILKNGSYSIARQTVLDGEGGPFFPIVKTHAPPGSKPDIGEQGRDERRVKCDLFEGECYIPNSSLVLNAIYKASAKIKCTAWGSQGKASARVRVCVFILVQ